MKQELLWFSVNDQGVSIIFYTLIFRSKGRKSQIQVYFDTVEGR